MKTINNSTMAAVILLLYAFASRITAHSWMRCSDYHADINGQDYNETHCTGWMRGEDFDGISLGYVEDPTTGGPSQQVEIGGGQALCQHALSGTADDNYGYA